MTRKLQFFLTALLLMVGVTSAWADPVNLLKASGITVSWTPKGGVSNSLTPSEEGTISFTPGNSADFNLSLSFTGVTINASNAYVVIQASEGALGNATKKIRNLKIDDKTFDYSNNLDISQRAVTLSETNYQVNAMAPLGKVADGTTTLFNYYYTKINSTMTLKGISFDLRGASADEITIHKVYLCSIAEIMALYNKKVQFVKNTTDYPRIDVLNNAASNIQVGENGTITFSTTENAVVFFKSLGTVGNTTEIDFRNLAITTGTFLHKETMANLSDAQKVNLNATVYKYFPTGNQNVALVGTDVYNRYRHFKDGVAPNSSAIINAGSSSNPTVWYASCARNLINGYNSMILPFDVAYDDINAMGLTAYTYTSFGDGKVTFAKLTEGEISMHTPFIVKCDETNGGLYQFPSNGSISNYNSGTPNSEDFKTTNYYPVGSTDCYFIGSYINEAPGTTTGKGWPAEMTSDNYNFYGIKSDGLSVAKLADDTKTTYYRAFLAIDKSSISARALTLSFDDEETTGISTSLMNNEKMNNQYFDLSGRRVVTPTKGLYIVNGKKVVIK